MSLFESEALKDTDEALIDEANNLFWQSAGRNKRMAKRRARPTRMPHGHSGELAIISPDELVSRLHNYNGIRLSTRTLLRYEKKRLVAAAERGRTGRGKGRGHSCDYNEDAYYDAVAACNVPILVNISLEELADLRARALQKLQEQGEGMRFAVQSEAEEMWLFYREFLKKFWEIGGDFVIAKYPEIDKKRDGEPVYASVRCIRTHGDKPIQYLADLTGTDDRYIDTVDVKDIFYDMICLQKDF